MRTSLFKKYILLPALLLSFFFAEAQIDCTAGSFYGFGSDGSIYQLTLSGNNITLGSAQCPPVTTTRNGLAIADLGSGSKFYSSGTLVPPAGYDVLEYASGNWSSLLSNPYPNSIHNSAGRGNLLYYQYIGSTNQTGNARFSRIFRFDGNTLPVVFEDSTVFMKVADIAIDNNDNLYFFSDSISYPNTDVSQLNIMSPSGVIIARYPVSFDGDNAYGAFLQDSVLYVGLGPSNLTHPNTLLPIIITGSVVTLGTPIPMPHPVIGGTIGNPIYLSFSDLASCADAFVNFEPNTVGLKNPVVNLPSIYPNPVHDQLFIRDFFVASRVTLYDLQSRIILEKTIGSGDSDLDLSGIPAGLYVMRLINSENSGNFIIIKE
ncbi:MAG: T9SS type A sorting domain-containing protein [Bacteroidetes bacterium]|nr:T9SS type A sorting domain-containing protein [Bacteroidota bacterium]